MSDSYVLNQLTNWVLKKENWQKEPGTIWSNKTRITASKRGDYKVGGVHVIKVSVRLDFDDVYCFTDTTPTLTRP